MFAQQHRKADRATRACNVPECAERHGYLTSGLVAEPLHILVAREAVREDAHRLVPTATGCGGWEGEKTWLFLVPLRPVLAQGKNIELGRELEKIHLEEQHTSGGRALHLAPLPCAPMNCAPPNIGERT